MSHYLGRASVWKSQDRDGRRRTCQVLRYSPFPVPPDDLAGYLSAGEVAHHSQYLWGSETGVRTQGVVDVPYVARRAIG